MKLTTEQRAEIKKKIESGDSIIDIANDMKVAKKDVKRFWRRMKGDGEKSEKKEGVMKKVVAKAKSMTKPKSNVKTEP